MHYFLPIIHKMSCPEDTPLTNALDLATKMIFDKYDIGDGAYEVYDKYVTEKSGHFHILHISESFLSLFAHQGLRSEDSEHIKRYFPISETNPDSHEGSITVRVYGLCNRQKTIQAARDIMIVYQALCECVWPNSVYYEKYSTNKALATLLERLPLPTYISNAIASYLAAL